MSRDFLLNSPLLSWLFAAGIVWGPGLLALHLQENNSISQPTDTILKSQQQHEHRLVEHGVNDADPERTKWLLDLYGQK